MQYTVTTPTDLLLLLREYQALTIFQIVKLLDKEKTITNIRPKLHTLAKNGLVAIQRLPRSNPFGSSPFCYSLTSQGIRALANTTDLPTPAKLSEVALEHTVSINNVAVLAHLLTRQEKRITLTEIRHESLMKKNPIVLTEKHFLVPDLFVRFTLAPPYGKQNEQIGLLFEIDHKGTEWADIIKDKAKKYVDISYGMYQKYFGLESLSVIFLVTGNGKTRVKNILSWIQQTFHNNKEDADIFLCAALDPCTTHPLQFFCDPLFFQPFDSSLHPLIEKTKTL
jgi:hypothetical protein